MLKKQFTIYAFCAVLLAGFATPSIADSSLTISLEPLYMHRSMENSPLTLMDTDADGVGDTVVMDTKDAEYDWGGGVKLSVKKNIGENVWEGGFMYINQSGSSSTPPVASEPYSPYLWPGEYDYDPETKTLPVPAGTVNIEPFEYAYKHSIDIESTLLSFEVNRTQHFGKNMQWLLGARIVSLKDSLDFRAIDDVPPYSPPTSYDSTGRLKIKTSNILYGVQCGVMGLKELSSSLRLSGSAKLGLYANNQKKKLNYLFLSNDSGTPDPYPFDAYHNSDSNTKLSTMIEAGINLGWAFNKTMTLNLGYFAMYMTGIANAAEQMPLANTDAEFTKFEEKGHVLYNGVKLGLVVVF